MSKIIKQENTERSLNATYGTSSSDE